jgi:predicted GH43/DUF377 family glycosyl hydrolase
MCSVSLVMISIMVYTCSDGTTLEKVKYGDGKSQKLIFHGVAPSSYNNWNHHVSNPVVKPKMPYEMWMDSGNLYAPTILKKDGQFWMWYGAQDSQGHDQICLAFSDDGIKWRRYENNPVIPVGDNNHVNDPTVVVANGKFYMYYTCAPEKEMDIIYLATSDDGIHWELHGEVISTGKLGSWDSLKVGRPSVIYEDGIFKVWFDGTEADPDNRDKMRHGTGRHVGFARSSDGINFDKEPEPIYMNSGAVDVAHVGNEYIMLFESQQGTHWAVGKTETQFEYKGLLIPKSGESYDRYGHVTPTLLMEEGKWTAVYYGAAEGLEKSSAADWNRNRIGMAFPQLKIETYSLSGEKLDIACKALSKESLELHFAVTISDSIRLRVLDGETILLDNILEDIQGGEVFLLKR